MSRKLLLLMMAVIVLFSTLSLSTSNARAAGTLTYQGGLFIPGKGVSFVFSGSGYNNKAVKGASIFAGSNFYSLSCNVSKGDGKVVCVAGGRLTEFGGETGIIHLAGQIFYITIPRANLLVHRCDEEETLGADVAFDDTDGTSFFEFVPGKGLEEVSQNAKDVVTVNELAGYEIRGDLYCDSVETEEEEVPEEEIPEPEEPV